MKSFWDLMKDGMAATGAAIVIFSVGLVILILVTAVPTGNPYIGLFTIIFLPILVIVGGLVFLFGVLLSRPERRRARRLDLKKWLSAYFSADFSRPEQRRRLTFFLIAGGLEMVVFSVGGFRLAQFMDTPQFCVSCHTVMAPEYTVYQDSPHARVPCVDCHIGPGAPWLVRSKVTGLRQVWHTLLKTYPRPIPTPIENLRPARETCEQCHWPERFSGNISRTFRHYNADEQNSVQVRTLVLKVGSGDPKAAQGIHRHISTRLWYLPMDEMRQQIGWVGVETGDGRLKQYADLNVAPEVTPQKIAKGKRLMDCIDCHNRATHVFRSPGDLIDIAFTTGKMDPSIPFLKDQGMKAMVPVNSSYEAARSKVDSILEFYKSTYASVYSGKRQSVESSVEYLKEIARLTTFPYMRVDWRTHPDNLGHTNSPGCFRCHGKLISLDDGKPLDASCTLCHDFAAQ